jgi:hypothetical protein
MFLSGLPPPHPKAISDVPKSRIPHNGALARTCLKHAHRSHPRFCLRHKWLGAELKLRIYPPLKGGHIAAGSLAPSPEASISLVMYYRPPRAGFKRPYRAPPSHLWRREKLRMRAKSLGCTYSSESCVSSGYTRF